MSKTTEITHLDNDRQLHEQKLPASLKSAIIDLNYEKIDYAFENLKGEHPSYLKSLNKEDLSNKVTNEMAVENNGAGTTFDDLLHSIDSLSKRDKKEADWQSNCGNFTDIYNLLKDNGMTLPKNPPGAAQNLLNKYEIPDAFKTQIQEDIIRENALGYEGVTEALKQMNDSISNTDNTEGRQATHASQVTSDSSKKPSGMEL